VHRGIEVLASNGRAVPVVVGGARVPAPHGHLGPTTRGRGTHGERDGRTRLRGATLNPVLSTVFPSGSQAPVEIRRLGAAELQLTFGQLDCGVVNATVC
jgi:hypothetical protein